MDFNIEKISEIIDNKYAEKYLFNGQNRKIIKKINRDFIGVDKIKQSLKETIGFKQLKNEELIHNYLSDFIKEKQLFVILEDVDKVNQLFV